MWVLYIKKKVFLNIYCNSYWILVEFQWHNKSKMNFIYESFRTICLTSTTVSIFSFFLLNSWWLWCNWGKLKTKTRKSWWLFRCRAKWTCRNINNNTKTNNHNHNRGKNHDTFKTQWKWTKSYDSWGRSTGIAWGIRLKG